MATQPLTFLSLLKLIVSLGPKIPKAMELLTALYNLFAADIENLPGGLEVVHETPEESALIEQISQAMSAEGSQAVFDGTRLRKLVGFLNNSGLGALLFSILTKAAAGS